MPNVHYGHIFHLAGSPKVTESAAALVSISDGALVVGDDGKIAYCGEKSELPAEYASATVHDHRGGFLLPGFVDTHVHFPQTYAGDSYGGGQLLEWLNLCMFPSESKYADPEFAQQAAAEFTKRRIAAGTTAAMAPLLDEIHRVVRLGVPACAGRAVHRDAEGRTAHRFRPRDPDSRSRHGQATDHLRGGCNSAHPRGDRQVARRRHRRRRQRAAARGDHSAILAVGHHGDVQKPW